VQVIIQTRKTRVCRHPKPGFSGLKKSRVTRVFRSGKTRVGNPNSGRANGANHFCDNWHSCFLGLLSRTFLATCSGTKGFADLCCMKGWNWKTHDFGPGHRSTRRDFSSSTLLRVWHGSYLFIAPNSPVHVYHVTDVFTLRRLIVIILLNYFGEIVYRFCSSVIGICS